MTGSRHWSVRRNMVRHLENHGAKGTSRLNGRGQYVRTCCCTIGQLTSAPPPTLITLVLRSPDEFS